MEKQVILLNGPSSSGKSSLAELLQGLILARRRERYEIVSIDDFLTMTAQEAMVARRTNNATEFGARLDTAADFEFVVVRLIRMLPVMDIPTWLYVWTSVITLIKGINIVSGVVIRKRFVAVHTVMNKATGALLFVLPLTVPLVELSHSAIVVCAIATFAAVQEGHLIRMV